ncbi:MAG: hypothetical protein CMH63_01460 [Nanoarchaeota archaeon]|jgi:uncharacterized membrane protein|nr:hypothetical protein [Nanoarchaeota archaeon]|tara:strand:- start:71271 stop:71834 length:564 start_codon:yes stop_codon:yes gene_type:complete
MPKKKKSSKKKKITPPILKRIEKKLDSILRREREQADSDEDLEEDLEEIKKDLEGSPLKKITVKDFGKALIGSFIGVTSHFVFLEGAHFADNLTTARASWLLIVAYVVGLIFIYAAGFKKVKQIRLLSFIPARITLIYIVALSVTFFVLYIYGITAHSSAILIYKQVAAVSIPAIIGASAADLIGHE